MAKHVIYVPGLGDHKTYGQPIILLFWRLFGVKVHYLAVGWHSSEAFDKKLDRLLKLASGLQNKHGSVSLVGISAGATAVLNAFATKKDITKVVCICGKINNPQTVGQQIYDYNPPFKESIYLLQKNLNKLNQEDRARIMSIHPLQKNSAPPVLSSVNILFYSLNNASTSKILYQSSIVNETADCPGAEHDAEVDA